MNYSLAFQKDIKKDFKKILEELIRRVKGKHCNNNITGIEIKLRRNLKALTLAELAEDICSVSYLCKVEQSQIKPNYLSLNDICTKLDISDDTLEVLMSLDKVLMNMVNAYFINDKAKMKKIYLSGKGLANYRYKIVEFIYNISNKEFDKAIEIGNELKTLINALNDIDLIVFAVFYNILNFNFIDSEEIYNELKILCKITPIEDNLKYLIDTLKIKCLFTMNSPLIIKSIDELSTIYLNIARFDLIDEIRYIEALYYLCNNSLEGYEKTKNLICSKTFIKNLELYKKVLNSERIFIKDLNNVSDYAYCVGLALIDGPKALELLNDKLIYNSSVECDDSIVEYLTKRTVEEKYNFISFVALPSVKLSKNRMVAKFYENELIKITKETNKYKLFYQFFLEMNS